MISSGKSSNLKNIILSHSKGIEVVLIFILLGTLWAYYYFIGSPSFNKSNAVSIFGIVIEGMSALLSVSIAVIVFRIQSLENRNQLLEESTLNFMFQTTRSAYPKWIPSVEDGIRSGTLAKRYYDIQVDRLNRTIGLSETDYEKRLKELGRDRDTPQKRLMETLNRHTRTKQTIQRTRKNVFSSMVFLIFPILFSFFLLMISDALAGSIVFYLVSLVVLMSAIGIVSLVFTVLKSTVQSDESEPIEKTDSAGTRKSPS